MNGNKKLLLWKVMFVFLIVVSVAFAGSRLKMVMSEAISTQPLESGIDAYSQIQKMNEISLSALEKGSLIYLKEKDAMRINYGEKDYVVIVVDVEIASVDLLFQGEGIYKIDLGGGYLADLDRDGSPDIELSLKEIEDMGGGYVAKILVKLFEMENLVSEGDYNELFDVTIRLTQSEVYDVGALGAFVTFENFGEGPSEIDIVYSIVNELDEEVYRGVDSKVVQTEDRVIKKFDFLEIPNCNYVLRTEIFYGENQTGLAEQQFEIIEVPAWLLLREPLIFIGGIVILFILVVFMRRYIRKDMGEKDEA